MASIQQILDRKGSEVYSVAPDSMVLDALKLMAEKDIGSVAVMSGDRMLGLFTERRYTRDVFLKGRSSPSTPIRDVMETEIVYVDPDQSHEACMALMSEKRIRHLPVMSEGKVVGMVSIGDVMKATIDEQGFNIEQLVKYIQG